MKITIQHQTEKTYHTFGVTNPNSLTTIEVWTICTEMNVKAVLKAVCFQVFIQVFMMHQGICLSHMPFYKVAFCLRLINV